METAHIAASPLNLVWDDRIELSTNGLRVQPTPNLWISKAKNRRGIFSRAVSLQRQNRTFAELNHILISTIQWPFSIRLNELWVPGFRTCTERAVKMEFECQLLAVISLSRFRCRAQPLRYGDAIRQFPHQHG